MNIVLIAFSQEQQIKTVEKYPFASTYIATSDIYQQIKQLWQFDKAVIVLDNLSLNISKEYKDENLTNNLEPSYSIFKTLKLLGYQQVLVSLELIKLQKYKQAISQLEKAILSIFEDQERECESERNVFSLKNPALKVVQNCESDQIQKFFHNETNQNNKLIFQTECIVIRLEEEYHVIKVLQGNLYVGQLLKSIKAMSFIKQIKVSQTGEIFVKFEDNKRLDGILCSYQHCPEEITKFEVQIQLGEIPIQPPKDAFRKMGQLKMIFCNQEFEIQNSHNNPIKLLGIKDKNGQFIESPKELSFGIYKLSIQLIDNLQVKLLNTLSKPVIFFINQYQTMVFYGYISNIIEKKNRNVDLSQYFPIQKFQSSQNMIIRDKDDLRYFCRICKVKKVNQLLKECGHLRYCSECVEQCIEIKECFYCSKSLTQTYPLSIIYLDQKTYEQLQNKKNWQSQISSSTIIEENKVPTFFKLMYQQQKEGSLDFFSIYCKVCDNFLITRLFSCQNRHLTLTCENCNPINCQECQEKINHTVKICYIFQDDQY